MFGTNATTTTPRCMGMLACACIHVHTHTHTHTLIHSLILLPICIPVLDVEFEFDVSHSFAGAGEKNAAHRPTHAPDGSPGVEVPMDLSATATTPPPPDHTGCTARQGRHTVRSPPRNGS